MNRIKSILVLAALAAGTLLYGQGIQMPQATVTWKVASEQVKDSLYKIVFTGKIADGWHTYGLESDLYPTGVEFSEASGYSLSGKPYEVSRATDYEGIQVFFDEIVIAQDIVRETGRAFDISGEITWMGFRDTGGTLDESSCL